MCRWLAYRGEPILLETLVCAPEHSLVAQSLSADEAKVRTNGDGFGLGWYGERAEPGLYRELRPAWSDENLQSICAQVRSRLFFAHVRAATGTAIARANCHPFAHGSFMFMHNGQVGSYGVLKRRIEAMIPDALYPDRTGATDSEAIFLAAMARGMGRDPLGALASTLKSVKGLMDEVGSTEPLRFTAALTNGSDLYAVRWASDDRAPSLYFRQTPGALVVVSEPLDGDRTCWREVPKGCALVARGSEPVRITCMNEQISLAA